MRSSPRSSEVVAAPAGVRLPAGRLVGVLKILSGSRLDKNKGELLSNYLSRFGCSLGADVKKYGVENSGTPDRAKRL